MSEHKLLPRVPTKEMVKTGIRAGEHKGSLEDSLGGFISLMYQAMFDAAPGSAERELRARVERLEAALRRAVEAYGKPGGPWNVPGEPGSWIAEAQEALENKP